MKFCYLFVLPLMALLFAGCAGGGEHVAAPEPDPASKSQIERPQPPVPEPGQVPVPEEPAPERERPQPDKSVIQPSKDQIAAWAAEYADYELLIREVRGSSMVGLINTAETVYIVKGFYKTEPIEVQDVVAYLYAGNDVPIIKRVVAGPGDAFRTEAVDGGSNILVNDKVLETTYGEPYLIRGKGLKMINLYVKSYGKSIPKDTCLIMGNRPGGTADSTRFGLVHRSDMLGKVLYSRLK